MCGLLFSGCGTSASQRDVADVVEHFQAALEAHDGAVACAELTAATRGALKQQEQKPCDRALFELDLRGGGTVSATSVYLSSSIARIAGRGAAFLDQTPRGWRIGAAGCSPTQPGLPYDCELEGG